MTLRVLAPEHELLGRRRVVTAVDCLTIDELNFPIALIHRLGKFCCIEIIDTDDSSLNCLELRLSVRRYCPDIDVGWGRFSWSDEVSFWLF